MRLEPQTRQFLNLCVAKARAFEREQLAAASAEITAARDTFYAEMAKIKADMLAPFFAMEAELERVRREVALLREWRDAHVAHVVAKQELVEIRRRHAIERAWETERDPKTPLQ